MACIWDPPQPRVGIQAGNRPSALALGFSRKQRGPYTRPEDENKPHRERRHDYYVDTYGRRLTRAIAAESTFYPHVRWRGLPVEIQEWCDPPPHGRRLNINMYPDSWPSFRQRDQRIAGLTDLEGIPKHELNAPEIGWHAMIPMLKREGWDIMDWYTWGHMAKRMCMIDELELIEGPWPQDVLDALEE
jgi:hypothetical protein